MYYMSTSVGIDISEFQSTVPAGPWLFTVHKATEGNTYVDPKFAERYPNISGLRGAYHYARPGFSDGATQANFFADTVLAAGFKPGVDLWQLDCEDGENAGVGWQPFINEFMLVASKRLGNRGFVYAGYPFLQTHGLLTVPDNFHWWLPDYSVNDGQVHPVQCPQSMVPLVVLHQFTSNGNLDQNVVLNAATWNAIVGPPVDLQAIAKAIAWLRALTKAPLQYGDRGPNVQALNRQLVRQGYFCGGDAYGDWTTLAVAEFKRKRGLKNLDGKVVGRACALALLNIVR